MKNLFKNKILIILSLLIILLFSISSNCFASTDFSYNNENYTLNDVITSYNYYCIFEKVNQSNSSKTYTIYLSNSRDFLLSGNFLEVTYNIETTYNSGGVVYYYSFNSLDELLSIRTTDLLHTNNGISIGSSGYYSLIYTNSDIYGVKNNVNGFSCIDYDNVVFHVAPQVEEQEEIPVLTQTLVEQTTKAQISEQLRIMIVGFLKYLIVFVISVLAFWKGWKFLSTQLKKA